MVPTFSQLPIQRCPVDSLKSAVVGVFNLGTWQRQHIFYFFFLFFFFWRATYCNKCYQYFSDGRDRLTQLAFICSFCSVLLRPNYTETQLLRASVYILNFWPRWSWKWKHIMLWIDRPNSVECPPIHYYTILIYMITFDPMVPRNCCFHYRICVKFLPILLKITEFFSCSSSSGSVIMNSFGPMLSSLRNDFLSSFVHSWEASMTSPAKWPQIT